MDILIKDGVKYIETDFHGKESEFEKIVFSQYKHLFGENSLLFTKQKIKTATGIGTIPDGFIIDFKHDKWFIIEIEISNHNVYEHIVPQVTKFKSALNHSDTKKSLKSYFEKEINTDPFKNALLISNGKREVFKTVSEIVDSNPELIIIIEQDHEELTSVLKSLPFQTRINVFKIFTRDNLVTDDSIFQIEPITTFSSKITIPIIKSVVQLPTESNHSNKKGRGMSDVLVEQIMPVIKSIQNNGKGYYTTACKEIAAKVGFEPNTVMSHCTRTLKLKSKDDFLQHVENGTIKDILKRKYPNRYDIIDKEL